MKLADGGGSKAADENVSISAPPWRRFFRSGRVYVRMRQFAAHVGRRLVLAQTFIDHLAQQIVAGPGEIFHFNHKLRPYPMHAAELERRSESAAARRWHRERHFVDHQRLQLSPKALQLRLIDAGADAAGKDKTAVGIVMAKQQGAELGARAFGIGPADHNKFLAVQAFDLQPQAAIAGRIRSIGAFRDDALERHRARLLMKLPPAADLVIAVVQG